ncbi:Exodeoxyribonuclease III [Granulibacter bethesdensis]|nr:Exodeoxyribonuclease III [Granulibacter bethesdensis]
MRPPPAAAAPASRLNDHLIARSTPSFKKVALPVKIATWNVNSIRQREGHVLSWLERNQPDILLLQEIKCETAAFPAQAFAKLGYQAEAVGQKAYNGVAVLSRVPFEVTQRTLPGLPPDDAQARYIEIRALNTIIGNLYLPNGNSGGEAGYAYKLGWMEHLAQHAASLLAAGEDLILAGDYNVCPTEDDYAPGALPPEDALLRPETRARFRSLLWLGLTDAVRAMRPSGQIYTFWDYQAGAWPRDRGLRIDHALLSSRMAERLIEALPDRMERDQPQPSDHVPVIISFEP